MKLLILFVLGVLVSCGKDGKDGVDGKNGSVYAPLSPIESRVDLADIEPGLACESGGVSVIVFKDTNDDGFHQEGEDVTRVKSICNGSSSSISLETIVSSETCLNGGVRISSSSASSSVEVCHGVDGLSGAQIIPVKFCKNDTSKFSEYGLMIGEELFAVYWDVKKQQSFLTKLVAGLYQSTGGNNCLFEIK